MTATPAMEAASVRDIPRSCSCSWHYATRPARWVLLMPDPGCVWHKEDPE